MSETSGKEVVILFWMSGRRNIRIEWWSLKETYSLANNHWRERMKG
jgi:hypothetical protein